MAPQLPRRAFVSGLAVTAAAVSAACRGASPSADMSMAAGASDDVLAWFNEPKGVNKAIYDCVNPEGGPSGVLFARNLIKFSHDRLGTSDADMAVVVSFRHFSTPFGYTDAMWAKYPQFAAMLKVTDPETKKAATRNWLLHQAVEGQEGSTLPALTEHGARFAVCGAATAFIAGILAGKTGDAKAIEAELSSNLIPSAKMMPAGVVGVQRAQRAGYAYTYAG